MIEDIYNPLEEYKKVYKEKFKSVAESTFDELVKASGIDVEANRNTCKEIYSLRKKAASVGSKKTWMTVLCVFLWIAVVVGVIVCIAVQALDTTTLVAGLVAIVSLVSLVTGVHPKISELKKEYAELQKKIKEKTDEAWSQMEPLNRLYDWDVFCRMVAKTVPRIEFDSFFTTKRLADLVNTYGWDESFNEGRSVIYSHSGLINGNPFVLCRTRSMSWGEKTYSGSRTIHWTTRERGSDGKYYTRHHSETLYAYVTRPYPEYSEGTRLIYGNTSAPDLVFKRRKNIKGLKKNSSDYKSIRKELVKLSQNLNQNFTMSNNEDFDIFFKCTNYNNSQQFNLLFTPLAQESMVSLLCGAGESYGDDFTFYKRKMINTIVSDHIQSMSLDMNPQKFREFDCDKARSKFLFVSSDNFRAFYFCLAPLLCIPLYQQIRPASAIYGRDMPVQSSYWEHESLANFWGQSHFQHPDCVTDSILKTSARRGSDNIVSVDVSAYGQRSERHSTTERVWGRDGRYHNVTVYYDEYFDVVGHGSFNLCEDTETNDADLDPLSRLQLINDRIGLIGGSGIYRRHIASNL